MRSIQCCIGWIASAALASCAPIRGGAAPAPLPGPEGDVFQQDVAWSPDGRWIAYSQYAGGADYDPAAWSVRIVAADGTGPRTLVDHAMFVSWSPDGRRLAFGSSRDGNPEIYTIAADGGGLERLTRHEAADAAPAWSPAGDRIAFSSDRDGHPQIYVMAADGSGVRRLTRGAARDYGPAWSPDGQRIAFYREKGDGRDQIHVVNADGSGERAVTHDENLNTFPAWLPDGRIGFSCKSAGGGDVGIFCVGPDGTGRTRVGRLEAFFARWSPDGGRIAFIGGNWPRSAIYVADADGTAVRKLVN